MRLRLVPLAMVLLFVTSLPSFAQWKWGKPRPPRSGACFYQDINFQGNYFCMKDGDRWPALPGGFNDSISSIRVFGGARLRVFYDVNFQGESLLLDHSAEDLRRIAVSSFPIKNWNDRISAIAVFRGRDEWEPKSREGR